jgi:hypothetical protein
VTRKLPAFLPESWRVTVERLAVTEAQIDAFGLATRAPKPADMKAGIRRCVELDAIDPPMLIDLLESAITTHLDFDEWDRTKLIEMQERETLRAIAKQLPTLLSDGAAA